ncbi:MAG: hypothetical protein U0136_03135 [Bdellovibrionota bacterium]
MRASILTVRLAVTLLPAAVWSSGCAATYRYLPWARPSQSAEASPGAPSMPGEAAVSPPSALGQTQGEVAKPAPLTVSVAQAFFVGEQLHVKVRLEAKTALPTDQIVVSVLGLREGQVVEKHHQIASRMSPDAKLYSGQSLLIPFALAGKDLSEYQVQCRWGADAVQVASHEKLDSAQREESDPGAAADVEATAVVQSSQDRLPDDQPEVITPKSGVAGAEVKAPMTGSIAETDLQPRTSPAAEDAARASLASGPLVEGPGKLEIKDVGLEEETVACGQPPCDRRYTLRARVVNTGGGPLSELELGVGLAWAEGTSLPKPPADYEPKRNREETVALKQIVLRPGDSKKLKIKIDRAVPVVPGGAFVPYIRIIQAKTPS